MGKELAGLCAYLHQQDVISQSHYDAMPNTQHLFRTRKHSLITSSQKAGNKKHFPVPSLLTELPKA